MSSAWLAHQPHLDLHTLPSDDTTAVIPLFTAAVLACLLHAPTCRWRWWIGLMLTSRRSPLSITCTLHN